MDDRGCLVWEGPLQTKGYGQVLIRGRKYLVHRLAYELWVGPIGEEHHLHHTCGRPECLAPQHLRKVTPLEHAHEHRGARKI